MVRLRLLLKGGRGRWTWLICVTSICGCSVTCTRSRACRGTLCAAVVDGSSSGPVSARDVTPEPAGSVQSESSRCAAAVDGSIEELEQLMEYAVGASEHEFLARLGRVRIVAEAARRPAGRG